MITLNIFELSDWCKQRWTKEQIALYNEAVIVNKPTTQKELDEMTKRIHNNTYNINEHLKNI